MYVIDSTKVKNLAVKDLILRAEKLAKQNLFGYKKVVDAGDMIVNFSMVEGIEDADTEATMRCIALALEKKIDKRLVNHYTALYLGGGSTVVAPGTSVTTSGYQGTIASLAEMTAVYTASNTDGWWWLITADIEFLGTVYLAGTEVFWAGSDFNKFGNRDEYVRAILSPSNTAVEADGNWRFVVDSGGMRIQKRIAGSWTTRNTIS